MWGKSHPWMKTLAATWYRLIIPAVNESRGQATMHCNVLCTRRFGPSNVQHGSQKALNVIHLTVRRKSAFVSREDRTISSELPLNSIRHVEHVLSLLTQTSLTRKRKSFVISRDKPYYIDDVIRLNWLQKATKMWPVLHELSRILSFYKPRVLLFFYFFRGFMSSFYPVPTPEINFTRE